MNKLLITLSILLIAAAAFAEINKPVGDTTGEIYRPVGDTTHTEIFDKLRTKLKKLLEEAQICKIDKDCVVLKGGGLPCACYTAACGHFIW